MIPAKATLTPAEKLVGEILPNGWTVESHVKKKPGATGGYFSVGYVVRHKDGHEAYLKAIDFSDAFKSSDPARKLEDLTKTYNFERDLLEMCRNKKLDRVVHALEDGNLTIDGLPVPYIIFEMADGDMRAHMNLSQRFDLAWTLRMLHHVTVGLSQLHGVGIAHQDIKPSNVLVFHGLVSKLTDLGRSAHPDHEVTHNEGDIPGGLAYAPPELRYGFKDPDFKKHRFGSDTFLLSNIILFAFTLQTMSSVLFASLSPQHMPVTWKGTFQEVLPYLQNAFNDALVDVAPHIPEEVREEIILILRQLGEPDPEKRGDPLSRNNFSLQRFITRLDVLAYKAERNLF
jgi:serine/threonine protein kinase